MGLMTSEEYNKLFHYTTWDGVLGILKSQSIWATHCKFLNDYSELSLAKEKLVEELSPVLEEELIQIIKRRSDVQRVIDTKGGLKHVVQHETRAFIDAAYSATGEEIYICSFCGEDNNDYVNANGLLSQWRGYGHDGGVALVFNTRYLENIFSIEAERYSYNLGFIADVIYSDDETRFKTELSEDIIAVSEHFRSILTNIIHRNSGPPDASNSYPSFIKCISRYKHKGFKEENEIRAVLLPTNIDAEYQKFADSGNINLKPEKERKFRIKNERLVPYIKLFNSTDIKLPIEKIIVGPHRDKDLRATSLKVMLRNTNIEISVSEIPYIE